MKMAAFKLWHAIIIWIEGEWHLFKGYWHELLNWIMFGVCLAALCFVLA